MNRDEKIRLVHQMNEEGLLSVKGAVQEIAVQLDVSVPTVYRYLKM
jgi:predicted transcriptional regulator YheO